MKYYLIADLHITKDSKLEPTGWTAHFCEYIRKYAGIDTVTVFVLGDIIDKGEKAGAEAFARADEFFVYIRKNTAPHDVQFVFLPGNHDYQGKNLHLFSDFCRKHQSPRVSYIDYTEKSSWNYDSDYINFILTDTVNDDDYSKPGKLDYDGISTQIIPGKTNILLMHHRLLYEDNSPSGGIVEQEKAFRFLKEKQIRYVFCAHAHAARNNSDIHDIHVFGLGSLGVDAKQQSWAENETEQFDVLETYKGDVQSVSNMLYRSGAERYTPMIIYPENSPQYADGTTIPFIPYEPVKNYIGRQLVSHQGSKGNGLNAPAPTLSLADACLSRQYVLLIAEAGLGKSTELQNLAFCAGRHIRAVLLSLRDYHGGDIKDFVNVQFPQYRTLNPEQFLLILDGYDELTNPDVFKQALKLYKKLYPESRICISMRSNFYRHTDEVFSDFTVYRLKELTSPQIADYIQTRGIVVPRFLAECDRRQLRHLIGSPFYLFELCELYQSSDELPTARDIMRKIIDRHNEKDIKKFEYRKKLDEYMIEIETALTRFAVGMQLMQCQRLTEAEYQRLLSVGDRELLQYSSLTITTNQGHEFLHNIFREYLTAKYLSEKPKDEIISYISVPAINRLNGSWINVIGFVLQLQESDDLRDWIADVEFPALVKQEKDRLTSVQRFDLLQKIVEKVTRDRNWPDSRICSVGELANFSQSEESLDYLLTIISDPPHLWTFGFCLSVLSEYTDIYGKEDTVREALLSCINSKSANGSIEAKAIEAISSLGLNTDAVTEELKSMWFTTSSAFVRFAIYRYLTDAHLVNDNVNFILQVLERVRNDKSLPEPVSNEEQKIMDCLSTVDSPEAVHCVLQWAISAEKTGKSLGRNAATQIFNTAAKLYLDGESKFFDDVLPFLADYEVSITLPFEADVMSFLERTGTLEHAFAQIAQTPSEDRLWLIENLIDTRPLLFDYFCTLYENGEIENDLYVSYARQCRNKVHFARCASSILEKTGEVISEPAPIPDYREKSREDKQRFFDSLFDKKLADALLLELLDFCGSREISIGKFRQMYRRHKDYPPGTNQLRYAIIRSNLDESELVQHYFRLVDWDSFSLHNIISMLTENEVTPSESQESRIKTVYEKLEHSLDTHNAYSESEGHSTISRSMLTYLQLKRIFSWSSPEDIMLGLLEIPYFCMNDTNTFDFSQKYDYLEKELTKAQIKERITKLLKTEKRTAILIDLIVGCKKYNLQDGIDAAAGLCLRSDISSFNRRIAAEYLLSFAGPDYVIRNVLPKTDDQFFELLVGMLHKYQDCDLQDQICKRFNRTHSISLLQELISRGVPEALSYYIEQSKEAGHPMDAAPDVIPHITEEIENITDFELLPLLTDAVQMLCSPEFTDAELGSLDLSLRRAYINLSVLDYKKVEEHLIALKARYPADDKLNSFCNAALESIAHEYEKREVKALGLREVKNIIKDINI